jgi:hypothetical protein
MRLLRVALPLALSTAASLFVGCLPSPDSGGGEPTPEPTATPVCQAATPPPPLPDVFTPYVDVTLSFDAVQAAQTTGHSHYTPAFLVSDGGCRAVWGFNAR